METSSGRPDGAKRRRLIIQIRPLVVGFVTAAGMIVLVVLFADNLKPDEGQPLDPVRLLPLFAVFPWGIGGLWLMNRDLRSSTAEQRRDAARERGVLEQALPEAVPETERRAAASGALLTPEAKARLRRDVRWRVLLAVIFALLPLVLLLPTGAVHFLENLWPPLVWVLSVGYAWLYLGVANLVIGRKDRRSRGAADALPLGPRFDVWRGVAGALFFAYLVLPLLGIWSLCIALIFGSEDHPATGLILIGVALSLVVTLSLPFLLLASYSLLPLVWALRPVKRGDYDAGLRRAAWLLRLHSFRGEWENLRGFVLYLAGRYDEAEQVLPQSIRTTRGELGRGGSDGLDNMGCVLAARGRYDEAVALFEGSIGISPDQVGAYVDLAGTLLRMGGDPEKALSLTERAWDNLRASRLRRWFEAYLFGFIWTQRGWALAALGRTAEAREAVERGIAGTDRKFLPELAGTCYYAARAMLVIGDTAAATKYLEYAGKLDPRGHYGRLAREAMAGGLGA